jgi:meso-butanediol dehydrogenase/(S,S)-butanediol dehydrogenase/diacetyl reductase
MGIPGRAAGAHLEGSPNGMTLDGKVALVTGAGQGIGRAIALRLASDGARVAVNDINQETGQSVVAEIRQHGAESIFVPADVTDRNQLFAAVEGAAAALHGFDIMVNNAGIVQIESIDEMSEQSLDRIIAVNLRAVIWGMQAAAAQFRRDQVPGVIINACSGQGFKPSALFGSYAMTKFAVRAITQVAAQEYATDGIRVNAYAPGVVETAMWQTIDERLGSYNGLPAGENKRIAAERAVIARSQTPEDVANLVSFLAGGDSDFMTGQTLRVDGGRSLV